jgi:SnoaL-like domain
MTNIDIQLQLLIDKQALKDLGLRYARAIDRRKPEALKALYHLDAIDEHGTVFSGTPVEFADAQPALMDNFELTAHYIINSYYVVEGDRAEGELYFIAYHRTKDNTPQEIIVGGRYLDKYVRCDGEWKILHRLLVWDHVRSSPVGANDLEFLFQLGKNGKGIDDISEDFFEII